MPFLNAILGDHRFHTPCPPTFCGKLLILNGNPTFCNKRHHSPKTACTKLCCYSLENLNCRSNHPCLPPRRQRQSLSLFSRGNCLQDIVLAANSQPRAMLEAELKRRLLCPGLAPARKKSVPAVYICSTLKAETHGSCFSCLPGGLQASDWYLLPTITLSNHP